MQCVKCPLLLACWRGALSERNLGVLFQFCLTCLRITVKFSPDIYGHGQRRSGLYIFKCEKRSTAEYKAKILKRTVGTGGSARIAMTTRDLLFPEPARYNTLYIHTPCRHKNMTPRITINDASDRTGDVTWIE